MNSRSIVGRRNHGRRRLWGRVGAVLFAAGVVFIAIDVLPFFAGRHDRPLWLNLACLLAPIGVAIAVWSVVGDGRDQQQEALRSLAADDGAGDAPTSESSLSTRDR